MKILRLLESLDPVKGGPAYSVRESSNLLSQRGHQVDVLTLDHAGRSYSGKHDFGYFKEGPGWGGYGLNIGYLLWLRRNIAKYDVILIHGIWQWQNVAFILAGGLNAKYIVMPHGSLDVWDRFAKPFKFALKRMYWNFIERVIYKEALRCWFTTPMELEASTNQFPFSGISCEVVPYGAVPAGEARLKVRESDFRTFGYLGRIHPKKGIELLIEAFSEVKATCADVRLVIAGDGDRKYVDELVMLAHRLGVAGDIEWRGAVYAEAKADMLRDIGLFVLPSYQENFGLAVAEALSVGTPVLISDQVNVHPMVSTYRAGFVCSRRKDDFVLAMRGWVAAVGSADGIRDNALRCFNERMSLTSYVAAIEQISI